MLPMNPLPTLLVPAAPRGGSGRAGLPTTVTPGGNVTVNLIEPGTAYGDRLNEVDLRLAKIVRIGRTRTNVGFDVNDNPNLPITGINCRVISARSAYW